MSLSFSEGDPIAYINGGEHDGKVLFCSRPEGDRRRMPCKELYLNKGKFEILLNPKTRESIYIAGPSGVGKSTICGSLILVYHELNPNSPIFLFSKLTDDPAFDKLERAGIISRIVLDESILETPIEVLDEVDPKQGALFVFDDTDTISNKGILQMISNLKRDILEIGRHNNIYSIQTSHLINGTNKNDTRYILNELNKMIIFPGSGGYKQQRYVLENYWGLNRKEIDKMLETSSRWICLSKNYPQYVLTEFECYLLK